MKMNRFLLASAMLAAFSGTAPAQTATSKLTVSAQPIFIQNNKWADLGNGPMEIITIDGSGYAFTSLASGVGSTTGGTATTPATTTLTLTATPASPPCVGCGISGTGITAGTTVTAVAGAVLTLSAAMNVAANTPVSWGVACPTSGAPPATLKTPALTLRVNTGQRQSFPLATYARVCAFAGAQSGAEVITTPYSGGTN